MKGAPVSARPAATAAFAWAAAALAGCPQGTVSAPREAGFAYPPRAERLERKAEENLVRLLDDLRGKDYLARVKAEGELRKLMAEAGPRERARMARYVVALLNEPQWGVREVALRILMEHGRDCPEAVAELVQVLGDMNVNAPTRHAVARTLAQWTGDDLGYDAFELAPRVKAAAAEWRRWLGRTGGRIPP